jgi:hypothetical protein
MTGNLYFSLFISCLGEVGQGICQCLKCAGVNFGLRYVIFNKKVTFFAGIWPDAGGLKLRF